MKPVLILLGRTVITKEANTVSVEENKTIVRRNIEEVFNKGDLSIVDEIIAPNWVFYGPGGQEFKGREGFRQIVTMLHNAFPDLRMTIEDMVAEGDMVAVRYIIQGTLKGQLMGMAPTGKQMTITSALFILFENGKVIEVREIYDQLSAFRQLGVSPPAR
jgi:steroid delta-isomerase-like uncharacterized protein